MSQSSLWLEANRPTNFESLEGDVKCDVAIVGGGITGLTAAYLLQEAGSSVVLLEKGQIIGGETGKTTAHLTEAIDTRYHDLLSRVGLEKTKAINESKRAAILQIESTVTHLGIDCGFRRVNGYLFSEDDDGRRILERELRAAESLGIGVTFLGRIALPFRTKGAVVWPNQAQLSPTPYCEALARRLVDGGGRIFEHTLVTGVRDGNPCEVSTPAGSVSAGAVLVCANVPVSNRVFLHTKIASYRSYVVAFELGAESGIEGLFWDTMDPYHYLRTVEWKGRRLVIVGGEDHKVGLMPEEGEPFRRLESYVTERFEGPRFRNRWSGQIVEPVDGLPYVGRNSLDKRIFVATGYAGNGMTYGTLSAMMLADAVLERENPWNEIYKATRHVPVSRIGDYVAENKDFPVCLVEDRLKEPASAAEVARGEGAILKVGGKRVAAYRNEKGSLTMLSPACPHLGCYVHWNGSEKTWDCPCHGSRFDVSGEVLNGPALSNLQPIDEAETAAAEEDATRRRTVGE